jgi:hypothetical protein
LDELLETDNDWESKPEYTLHKDASIELNSILGSAAVFRPDFLLKGMNQTLVDNIEEDMANQPPSQCQGTPGIQIAARAERSEGSLEAKEFLEEKDRNAKAHKKRMQLFASNPEAKKRFYGRQKESRVRCRLRRKKEEEEKAAIACKENCLE